ncbi:hypothetical protein [Streptomyces sp. NPDC090022]|uniref:hypothetical protein n=1 Tax=Streptomyces sp. NPDC090022 TaxID=3365920 RepID=UPI003814FDFA
MPHVTPARGALRRRTTALFAATTLTLSLSATVTLASAGPASALCVANSFTGKWTSSDDRLSRIDVWHGNDCRLYLKAWSTCKNNARRDCPWNYGSTELKGTPERNFRFADFQWNNASEVLQLRLQTKTRMSVWDRTLYNSGKDVRFTVQMTKSN